MGNSNQTSVLYDRNSANFPSKIDIHLIHDINENKNPLTNLLRIII